MPLHVHAHEEEHFVVVEGRVHLTNGDEQIELSAGEAATVRRGTLHAWANLSDAPVRMLVIFAPGHQETAFRMIAIRADRDLARVAEETQRLGTTITGPPPYDDVYSVLSPRPAAGDAA